MEWEDAGQGSIVIDITRTLMGSASIPTTPTILKVDRQLWGGGGDNVYDPKIISIGPYHHGKPKFMNMEFNKQRYLQLLLQRIKVNPLDMYVSAAVGMEKMARKCYAESIDLNESDFVKMMVLDACFLVEFLRYHGLKNLRDPNDPLFGNERILRQLQHDILLLENQLPFFVLNHMFNMSKSEDPNDDLTSLILLFAKGKFLNLLPPAGSLPIKSTDHMFEMIQPENFWKKNEAAHWVWEHLEPVSNLRSEGIKFSSCEHRSNILDIEFAKGVLIMPQLVVYDKTESLLKNVMAYEHYQIPCGKPRYVSDYVFFFNCLINTPEDVKWLRRCGIIESYIENDEDD
ncbi:UNVERIFIED_CONTAM: hypothetical protein Sangu_1967700 [Sesamum angustifolium]|uniref:Uncharacterized protein n=1 Tax=Sesamum angustifolium TaxID=2727405 RepID=A0AAW2LYD3_9LAMI